jgi:hypothetical protein
LAGVGVLTPQIEQEALRLWYLHFFYFLELSTLTNYILGKHIVTERPKVVLTEALSFTAKDPTKNLKSLFNIKLNFLVGNRRIK